MALIAYCACVHTLMVAVTLVSKSRYEKSDAPSPSGVTVQCVSACWHQKGYLPCVKTHVKGYLANPGLLGKWPLCTTLRYENLVTCCSILK